MVAFEEHFWGDKYNGFEALHTNYKQGISASKEFLDFVKERTTLEETYAKALQKLAHKCTSSFGHVGSFEPCWKFVQSSTEKLSNVHLQIVQNLNDVTKALKEYHEQQKDKQKQMKDDFSSMSDMVQSILALNSSVLKAKESYVARCAETEKTRKECTSLKEVANLEKVESKLKKTSEEYKSFIERRENTRSDFQKKLTETSKKFQVLELDHLTEILAYLGRYGNSLKTERVLLDQIIEEFTRNMDAFKVNSLLEQFVCAKETGKEIPAPMEFEEVTLTTPPVDIEALTNKEELRRKAKKERKTRKKKEKEKATANGTLQIPHETQKKEEVEVDEDGYSIRPADPDTASVKSGKSRHSFSSGSGSDSDDDYPPKIQVKIKPKEEIKQSDASIDALKSMTAALTLTTPATIQRRLNTGSNLDNTSKKLSRSNNALLDIEQSSNSDTASIKSLPLSTSLDTFQPVFVSSLSANTSKENSFGDFENLFESSTFNSSASLNSDWASDFTAPSDAPKSTSEARQDDEETPPPLPSKNRSYQDEFTTLPRSSKSVAPASPPELSIGSSNETGNIDKSVTLPRMKTMSAGQFPQLAPPIAARRNTSGGRGLHNRPQPAVPQQKQPPQSSLVDLMDIFSAPPPMSANPAPKPQQDALTLSQNSVFPSPNSLQTAGLVSTAATSDVKSASPVMGLSRGDQQALNTVPAIPPQTSSSVDRPIPIAVAFIETVNAYFKGADQTKLMVKITGDMTVSFPSTIIPVLISQNPPVPLSFNISGTNSLEQIFPNKALVSREGQLTGGDTMCFKFNMEALATYLKKQSEQNSASFYNIDIIKYQVRSGGLNSTPLQLRSFWRCDPKMTDLKIDYEFNQTSMKPPGGLSNVSVVVPVDGGVEIMHSKPSATWSGENQRAVWKIPILSQNSDNKGTGSLRARFEVSTGPSTPAPIAVQFSSDGSTISSMKFDLKSPAYKLSLVKRKFSSGKYLAEPISIPDKS